MLRDISIENYRLFRNFSLDSLARVNLIVGANNSGKSSFLEAVYLLTSEDPRLSLLSILDERGELFLESIDPRRGVGYTRGYHAAHMFFGHNLGIEQTIRIRSEQDRSQSLTISLASQHRLRQQTLFERKVQDDIDIEADAESLMLEYIGTGLETRSQSLRIFGDGIIDAHLPLRGATWLRERARLVTTSHLGYDKLAGLWDDVTLTPREEKVIEALQILEPKVGRISFTSRQTSNSGILLKLEGESEPIPLGSMGDGMRRILAIAASLVSVENGILLVDEIDTGLYYAVLTDMFRLILETASKRNAQVFATTHSWDCVRAFQEALDRTEDKNQGLLIRLEGRDGIIRPVYYSENELGIAIEQGIEVR